MARKFIIQDDFLKVGNVEMHFELKSKQSDKPVIGGGYWYVDKDRTTIYFYGKSIDFGKVTKEDLRHVKTNGMFSPSIEKLQWKWIDSDNITDVLERGENILELERGISITTQK